MLVLLLFCGRFKPALWKAHLAVCFSFFAYACCGGIGTSRPSLSEPSTQAFGAECCRGLCPTLQCRHTASFVVSDRRIADNLSSHIFKSHLRNQKRKHTLVVCFSFLLTRVAEGLEPHDLRPFEPILWRRKIIVREER